MKGWWPALGWASFFLAQVACAGDAQTGVLLTVLSVGEAPTSLEVLWLDGDKRLLMRRRLPESGDLPSEQASRFTLFIGMEPHRLGPRRVVAYGKAGEQIISQGMAHIDDFAGGRRDVEVVLGPDPLADGDADGIPDEVDACPAHSSPEGLCPPEPDPAPGAGADAGDPSPPDGDPGGPGGEGDPPTDASLDPPASEGGPDAAAPLDAAVSDRPPPPPPAFAMGTFSKSAGPAGTEQRVAHDLGTPPRALLLWTTGRSSEGFGAGITFSMGVSDGVSGGVTGGSRALAFASADTVITSQASRRIDNHALSVSLPDGSDAAQADLVAWDAASFTLRWTTAGTVPTIVHALVIGGAGVAARVLDWPTPTSDGPVAITGVGFRPEVVINLHVGLGFTATLPGVMDGGAFGLGVMTRAGRQWANALAIPSQVNPTDGRRIQRTDAAVYLLARDPTVVAADGVLRSMDPDGFTLDFHNARSVRSRVVSLALTGVSAAAGGFLKATIPPPVDQKIEGLGFRPGLLLLSSVEGRPQSEPSAHARLVLGGSDGARAACSTLSDTAGLPFSTAGSFTSRERVFVKADQDQRLVQAQASPTLDDSGFSLRWLGNDLVPIHITYLAFGPPR